MKKKMKKMTMLGMGVVCSAGLVLGLAATVQAGPTHENDGILLRDATGAVIPFGATTAFSLKETCGACHDGTGTHGGPNGVSYASIEKHGFHSQMGANQLYGWNSWNPDSANKFLVGPGAKAKNWVQSPGHVGKW